MRASSFRTAGFSFIHRTCRARPSKSTKLFFSQTKYTGGLSNTKGVPPNLLAAEKEEAKAVLTLFLNKQGLTKAVAARTIKKADVFINHLISRLHSVHKSRYLAGLIRNFAIVFSQLPMHFQFPFHAITMEVSHESAGRELTTLEIRNALIPYLESLIEEYGNNVVNFVESFSYPSVKDMQGLQISLANTTTDSNKLKASSQVSEIRLAGEMIPLDPIADSKKKAAITRVVEKGPAGTLRPNIGYLIELGMAMKQIEDITCKFPNFAYYSLEGKVKPLVEFLLELGVPKSDIPTILYKRPQLCGLSLTENLKPSMSFLEDLGMDKTRWAKLIVRFPAILTYTRLKVNATIDFLHEIGLSEENIGKVLTRCPSILSYSVEDKLRPTAVYFRSLGVDVGILLLRCPQIFGLSLEASLKPVTEFFLEREYSLEEVKTMVTRYGALYSFSITGNLVPKWEFFLTMNYSKPELVKFPQYFGYSLEKRIKPRYARVEKSGVRMLLNQVLSLRQNEFERVLNYKVRKCS